MAHLSSHKQIRGASCTDNSDPVRENYCIQKTANNGQALAAGLRVGLKQAKVPVMLSTGLKELSVDSDGRVNGVIAEQNGELRLIKARKGVIMGSGGFERNLRMRQRYQRSRLALTGR